MNYLVDSTVLIDWMHGGRNPIRLLAPWLRQGALVGCGIVRAEVLRGLVSQPAKHEMELLFGHIPEVPFTADLWRETADLAWDLDRAGNVLPLTDLAIAVCARRARATLVTHDQHFHQIPDLLLLRELP